MNDYFIYHIYDKNNKNSNGKYDMDEGYVGITDDYNTTVNRHKHGAIYESEEVYKEIRKLGGWSAVGMNKLNTNPISESEAEGFEWHFRKTLNKGWNTSVGGRGNYSMNTPFSTAHVQHLLDIVDWS